MATLARFDTWARSAIGPAAAGTNVYLCTQPSTTNTIPPSPLLQLYADSAGVTPITQPLIADGFGHAYAYCVAGSYTVVLVGGGVIQQVYPDQLVGDVNSGSLPSLVLLTNGTLNATQSALNLQGAGSTVLTSDNIGNVTITGTSFKTDGTLNPIQSTLNIIGTGSVSATSDNAGNVTIAGAMVSSVSVNGSSVTSPNFNGSTPAAPAGNQNVIWQVSGSSVSAYIPAGSSTGLNGPIVGATAPVPAYAYNESPANINPFFYVQDAAGNWHQQAGIDITTGPTNYPNSGPPVPGTLTWTRRQYFRDDLASTQQTKNAFLSVKHSAGSGTSQENQDRMMGLLMANGTALVGNIAVAGGVVTFGIPDPVTNVVPGQIYTLTGFSVHTVYNTIPYQITNVTATNITTVVAPLTLQSAGNASVGSTTYGGYINGRTLTGLSVLIAGFTNAANNGTFTVSSNTSTTIVVNNPSGVAETPATSIIPTATVQLANQTIVSDSGNLDQWMYSMAGIQCEVDMNGTPLITGSPDGEVSVFSGQLSLSNSGNVSVPGTGIQVLRAEVFKSGAGQITGASVAASVIKAQLLINNLANNGSTLFAGVRASVSDQVGGAPGTIGAGLYVDYEGPSRVTLANYGLYVGDFSQSYTVTSVSNIGGGFAEYFGTFPSAASLASQFVKISGFTNPGNNGVFEVSNNTTGHIVVVNAAAINETATVIIEMLSDYAIYSAGGQVYIGGNISNYNGRVTAGNGIPAEVNQIASTGLTANYNAGSAATIFTPTTASQLRISYSQAITTADAVSSTFPSLTLGWTGAGGIARTKTLVATSATNTTAVESDGVVVITTNASTPVTLTSASYASNTPATMAYALSVTTEVL